jgi:hypothetical protein
MNYVNFNNFQPSSANTFSKEDARVAILMVETKNPKAAEKMVANLDETNNQLKDIVALVENKLAILDALKMAKANNELKALNEAYESAKAENLESFEFKGQTFKVINESVETQVEEKFKYTEDDINTLYGFYGTLETNFKKKDVERMYTEGVEGLMKAYKISEKVAIAILDSRVGRHMADMIYSKIATDAVDALAKYFGSGARVWNYITSMIRLEESLVSEAGDHEVGMANGQLADIVKNAQELMSKIGTAEKDIPGWIQDHISQSQNYINQANSNYHELEEGVIVEAKFTKDKLLKLISKQHDAEITVKGKTYIIYNPDSNNDDNTAMWGKDTIKALNSDGDEFEFKYSDIDAFNESVVNEAEVDLWTSIETDFTQLYSKLNDLAEETTDSKWRKAIQGIISGLDGVESKISQASNRLGVIPVYEAWIGPFQFNDKMSDEELKKMYDDAVSGYANWQKGLQHPKSDYKKAYQEIAKILKGRGVKIDESIEINEMKKPKTWDSQFAMKAIDAYEAGEFDPDDDKSLSDWEKEYNGGKKPNPGFDTYNIIAYALMTGKKPDGSPIKESIEEALKSETPNEVITIELDMAWDDLDKEEDKAAKAAFKKYKIKVVPMSLGRGNQDIRQEGTFEVTGKKKDILAYLQSEFYEMDADAIEEYYPELLESFGSAMGLSKAQTKKVAETLAKAISKNDGVNCTVNAKTLEEDSFDLDIDGELGAAGSYNIYQDGSIVNHAVTPNEIYGNYKSTVEEFVRGLKKPIYESVVLEEAKEIEVSLRYARLANDVFDDMYRRLGKKTSTNTFKMNSNDLADDFMQSLVDAGIPQEEIY